MSISVLVPTLGRAGRLPTVLANIRQNTAVPFEVLFVVEAADMPSCRAVAEMGAGWVVNDGPASYAGAINAGYQYAQGRFIFTGADDLWFHPGWDTAALARMRDTIRVVGTNDLVNDTVVQGVAATHYLIDRRYIDEVGGVPGEPPGTVLFEGYDHNYTDAEFIDVARYRGVFAACLASVVEHLHPVVGKASWDPTYAKTRARFQEDYLTLPVPRASVDAVVTGAGGFIGGHLVGALLAEGRTVRALDVKPLGQWWQCHRSAENICLRLDGLPDCMAAVAAGAEVYHLAADMGGMGFIERQKAACALNVLPDANMLRAALAGRAGRFFYASTACVYRADRQDRPGQRALREDDDVYPAMPEAGYGEAKLFGERLCQYFAEDFGLECRVARYHSIFGPHGTWDGGREKAPAALCRKVAAAVLTGSREIEIWGDGQQQRSFLYVGDCVAGTLRLMRSGYRHPVNIGSSQIVTINELVTMLETIAGVRLRRRYVAGPRGVQCRSSDNTLAGRELGWAPATSLAAGMERTYRWVYDQLTADLSGRAAAARSAESSGRPLPGRREAWPGGDPPGR